MREIARRVLEAADRGLAFDQVGVLLRRPEAYRQAVRDVFGEAGIPHTWGAAPRLGETRAGRSLRLLLAARREDFARTAVIELLATAPLRQGGDAEPAEWDRLSREAGIVGGAADWRRFAGRWASVNSPALHGRVELEIVGLEGEDGAEVAVLRDGKGAERKVPLGEITDARLAFRWNQ